MLALTSVTTEETIYLNPSAIVSLEPKREQMIVELEGQKLSCGEIRFTIVVCGGLAYCVKENVKEILSMKEKLERKAFRRWADLQRQFGRDDWERGEDFSDEGGNE